MRLKLQSGDIKRPLFTGAGVLGNAYAQQFDAKLPPYVGPVARLLGGFLLTKARATRELGNGMLAGQVAAAGMLGVEMLRQRMAVTP